MAVTTFTPSPFTPGFRLVAGEALNQQFASPQRATQTGVTAFAGGGRTNAYKITTALTNVTTVATTADSVVLPATASNVGKTFQIANNGANSMQVFATGSDTINGTAGATGVAQAAGAVVSYTYLASGVIISATQSGSLSGAFNGTVGATTPNTGSFTTLAASGATTTAAISSSASHTFTAATAGIVLKQGANGLVGTFVCNGTSAVTVSNTNVAITDCIIISLNTVGGTVGAIPHLATITAGTGFTTVGTASDTSTYNYCIIKNAA